MTLEWQDVDPDETVANEALAIIASTSLPLIAASPAAVTLDGPLPDGALDFPAPAPAIMAPPTSYATADTLEAMRDVVARARAAGTIALDTETVVNSVRKTGRAIVADESPAYGGVAAELVASIQGSAFDYLDAAIVRVSAPHSPVPQSPALLQAAVPQPADIEAAIRTLLRPQG